MSKKFLFLISFVLVLSVASTSYGAGYTDPCVIGNWEDSNDGWLIDPCAPVGTTTEFNDTVGVTLDGNSLKLYVPEPNWQRAIYLQLDDMNLVDEFFSSDIFSVDVTRLVGEWSNDVNYAGLQLVVNANSVSGVVWQDLGGRVFWSPPDGNATQTAKWDYSATKALIDEATVSYLEFIIITNYDPCSTPPRGTYYLDNAQLRAYAGVIGDWENKMDGWAIWTEAPNGTTTDYNDTNGVTLNNYSLKLYVPQREDPEADTQSALYIQLDDAGLVDDFFRNSFFSVDVTRLAEEWGDPNATTSIGLIVNADSNAGSVFQSLGEILWWSPGDGNNPRTARWNYSAPKAQIDKDSISWLEFIIVASYDDVNYTSGTYYLDNAQLLPKAGYIVIGDWENTDDGWIEWTDPQPTIGPPKYTYVPTGATLNSKAVKMIPDDGYDQCLANKLQLNGLVAEGLANNKFSIDVTWDANDWKGDGEATVELIINESDTGNGSGIGWVGLGPPDEDTGNPDDPGVWDPCDFPGVHTRTMTWDYSYLIPDMAVTPDVGWFELILVTTYGGGYDADGNNPGNFYFDNARLTDGPKAGNPRPANGATDVRKKPTLSWRPGRYVDKHDVYFSTDETAVTDANRANDPCGVLASEDQNDNSYVPGELEFNTTYYWRVDEVNMADEPITMWKGDIWSFTTGVFIVVEDFDSYAEEPDLEDVWKDLKDNGTGAQIALEKTDPVRYGNSMLYESGMGAPDVAEAYANTTSLGIGSDWTTGGVEALVLYFYGDADNDDAIDQMYVKLHDADSNAKVIYDGDMNDINEPEWHEWNIDLDDFGSAGVTLTNVTRITIGFYDSTSDKADVYFDDIRLYLRRCVLSKRSDDFAKADYFPTSTISGDCEVGYQELEMMIDDWLIDDDIIYTQDPCTAGLVAYYPMDEGAGDTLDDATGDANHDGELVGGVTWTSGVMDSNGINVDGGDADPESRVLIGEWNPAEPNGQLTLAIWAKWAGQKAETGRCQGLIGKRNGWGSSTVMFMFEVNTNGNSGGFAFRQFSGGVYSPENIMIPFIDEWAHLAATFDGTTAILYLNGDEVASGSFSFGGGTDVGMAIGNTTSNEYWSEAFNGDLDEAYIFNRVLEPNEIAYLADTTPEDGEVYTPVPSVAELYSAEAHGYRTVNFKDFAIMAEMWLKEGMFP